MPVRQAILNSLNAVFRLRGMELRAVVPARFDSGMEAGLRRVGAWIDRVETVIDVGAAAGNWTRAALLRFPAARFLMVEPLSERVAELNGLCAEAKRAELVSAVAGRSRGEVGFRVAPDLDGSGVEAGAGGATRMVPMTTLDLEVAERKLRGPFFIKLDTHGFEVPILEGATAILPETAGLVIEAYNFQLTPESLRFHELCAWMSERGFRVADLLDPLRRPADGILWQMDLVFVRKDHPSLERKHY